MSLAVTENGTKKNEQNKDTANRNNNSSTIPWELRREQLSRHQLFFGTEGMERLRHAKVCVVGAGGVGSHTVCSLIRAGIGFIRVIDFDQVSLSSLNRHACATLADVGTPKITCLVRYAQQLCPDASHLQVEGRVAMYTAETGPELLQDVDWDFIVDAIDDVPTKAQLLYDAAFRLLNTTTKKVRLVSCMGAGGKADFTRLHLSDLKSASRDPLATKLRQCLKRLLKQQPPPPPKDESVTTASKATTTTTADDLMEDLDRLAILFSSEKTVQKLADFTEEQKQDVSDYGAVQGMRVRVLPVLGTMPAIMGQALAAWVLTELAEQPFQPVTGERVGRNVKNKLFQKLQTREDKLLQRLLQSHNITDAAAADRYKTVGGPIGSNSVWIGPLQIDMTDDMEYLLEVWRNRCAVTGARLGTVLELVRWDTTRPATCDNLILLSSHAKQAWDEQGDDARNGLPLDVRSKIEARLATCRVD